MSNILSYLYTGNVHVTEENISDLIVASDYLLLDDLLSKLNSLLKMYRVAANCLPIFIYALKTNREDFSGKNLNVFRILKTHFESIVHRKIFNLSDLPLEPLKRLLCDQNFCAKSERTVFLAIANWIEADVQNRLSHVSDMLLWLRIKDLDEDMAAEILKHDIVNNNSFCQMIQLQQYFTDSYGYLKDLHFYFYISMSVMTFSNHGQSTKVNCIAYYSTYNGKEEIQVYLTYGENIDLFAKITEIDLTEFLLPLDDCIYMFRTNGIRNFCYNVIQKRWRDLENFRISRYSYGVVKLDGRIYILGGFSDDTGEEIHDVEVYDSVAEDWSVTTPMIPVSSFTAISHKNRIYVLGNRLSFVGYEMVAQVYDPSIVTWNLLPSPSTTRLHFAMIEYHEKIYVMGGSDGDEHLKNVEVFDPSKNEWSSEVELPRVYFLPKAIVLNDKLIVYDNHLEDRGYMKTNPPVQWNSDKKSWDSVGEFLNMDNLRRHYFFALENYFIH